MLIFQWDIITRAINITIEGSTHSKRWTALSHSFLQLHGLVNCQASSNFSVICTVHGTSIGHNRQNYYTYSPQKPHQNAAAAGGMCCSACSTVYLISSKQWLGFLKPRGLTQKPYLIKISSVNCPALFKTMATFATCNHKANLVSKQSKQSNLIDRTNNMWHEEQKTKLLRYNECK